MASGPSVKGERGRVLLLACGFAAAAAVRIAFLTRLIGNYDLDSFAIVARIVRAGGNVYEETNRYNYSPVWAWALAGLSRVGDLFAVPLARAVTALLFAADCATAFVIYRILRVRDVRASRAGMGALLFFANPVSILASSVRGMFDDVAILFLLAGILAAVRPARPAGLVGPARRWLASAALAVSLLVKHVAWFHPLLFVRRRGRTVRGLWLAALPYAVFAASFLPYWRSWARIRTQVFGYAGLDEVYGLEPMRTAGLLPSWGPSAMCAAAGIAAALWLSARNLEPARAARMLFLVVLLFVPGVTPYYFVWPIALGALAPNTGYAVYTAVATLFFIGSPDGLALEWPHLPGWWGLWWATTFWLLWDLREVLPARRRST
jgi:hypothetical protein